MDIGVVSDMDVNGRAVEEVIDIEFGKLLTLLGVDPSTPKYKLLLSENGYTTNDKQKYIEFCHDILNPNAQFSAHDEHMLRTLDNDHSVDCIRILALAHRIKKSIPKWLESFCRCGGVAVLIETIDNCLSDSPLNAHALLNVVECLRHVISKFNLKSVTQTRGAVQACVMCLHFQYGNLVVGVLELLNTILNEQHAHAEALEIYSILLLPNAPKLEAIVGAVASSNRTLRVSALLFINRLMMKLGLNEQHHLRLKLLESGLPQAINAHRGKVDTAPIDNSSYDVVIEEHVCMASCPLIELRFQNTTSSDNPLMGLDSEDGVQGKLFAIQLIPEKFLLWELEGEEFDQHQMPSGPPTFTIPSASLKSVVEFCTDGYLQSNSEHAFRLELSEGVKISLGFAEEQEYQRWLDAFENTIIRKKAELHIWPQVKQLEDVKGDLWLTQVNVHDLLLRTGTTNVKSVLTHPSKADSLIGNCYAVVDHSIYSALTEPDKGKRRELLITCANVLEELVDIRGKHSKNAREEDNAIRLESTMKQKEEKIAELQAEIDRLSSQLVLVRRTPSYSSPAPSPPTIPPIVASSPPAATGKSLLEPSLSATARAELNLSSPPTAATVAAAAALATAAPTPGVDLESSNKPQARPSKPASGDATPPRSVSPAVSKATSSKVTLGAKASPSPPPAPHAPPSPSPAPDRESVRLPARREVKPADVKPTPPPIPPRPERPQRNKPFSLDGEGDSGSSGFSSPATPSSPVTAPTPVAAPAVVPVPAEKDTKPSLQSAKLPPAVVVSTISELTGAGGSGGDDVLSGLSEDQLKAYNKFLRVAKGGAPKEGIRHQLVAAKLPPAVIEHLFACVAASADSSSPAAVAAPAAAAADGVLSALTPDQLAEYNKHKNIFARAMPPQALRSKMEAAGIPTAAIEHLMKSLAGGSSAVADSDDQAPPLTLTAIKKMPPRKQHVIEASKQFTAIPHINIHPEDVYRSSIWRECKELDVKLEVIEEAFCISDSSNNSSSSSAAAGAGVGGGGSKKTKYANAVIRPDVAVAESKTTPQIVAEPVRIKDDSSSSSGNPFSVLIAASKMRRKSTVGVAVYSLDEKNPVGENYRKIHQEASHFGWAPFNSKLSKKLLSLSFDTVGEASTLITFFPDEDEMANVQRCSDEERATNETCQFFLALTTTVPRCKERLQWFTSYKTLVNTRVDKMDANGLPIYERTAEGTRVIAQEQLLPKLSSTMLYLQQLVTVLVQALAMVDGSRSKLQDFFSMTLTVCNILNAGQLNAEAYAIPLDTIVGLMKIKSKSAGNKSVLHIIDELLTDAGLSGFWDGWDHGTLSRAAEVVDELKAFLADPVMQNAVDTVMRLYAELEVCRRTDGYPPAALAALNEAFSCLEEVHKANLELTACVPGLLAKSRALEVDLCCQSTEKYGSVFTKVNELAMDCKLVHAENNPHSVSLSSTLRKVRKAIDDATEKSLEDAGKTAEEQIRHGMSSTFDFLKEKLVTVNTAWGHTTHKKSILDDSDEEDQEFDSDED